MTQGEMKLGHQFTIDPNGDGWFIECECGWSAWREFETQALNAYGEHEKEVKS